RPGAGRGTSGGPGVPRRDHAAGAGGDARVRGSGAAAADLRGSALVRRGLDGRADRDREARGRTTVPVPVRIPPGPTGAVLAPQAVARDRVTATLPPALPPPSL